MTKYQILINILDKIRSEASMPFLSKYNPDPTDIEKVNQARARAFIHLYFKVSFGILFFTDREHFITDGTADGGIDGYYIHQESKTIYFIQSKFRTNEKNFENKKIELDEILVMDINRILKGETTSETGVDYNGKIKQLQREISELENIARYSYKVIILANLSGLTNNKLRQLADGFNSEVFDYSKCYEKLVFPVISGTYFTASDVSINIDLSNKNAGSKISYTVMTKYGECEITVLFVPAIEIGKTMYKYKNSILKFNPRSYLDQAGKKINDAIKETIVNIETNEFALFNNGITMLSDETYINERIGQKNKAQLSIKNPQVINGGQTSFTLSRIYQEHLNLDVENIFQNKEVLLKVITFSDKNDEVKKIKLIEEISTATNQQTQVQYEDRFSNDIIHSNIQKILFERYNLLYEKKTGEFGDGIHNGYINKSKIVERNLFLSLYYSSNGFLRKAIYSKLFSDPGFTEEELTDYEKFDKAYFAYLCFAKFYPTYLSSYAPSKRNVSLAISLMEKNAQMFALTLLYKPQAIEQFEDIIQNHIIDFKNKWHHFVETCSKLPKYQTQKTNKRTGKIVIHSQFSEHHWYYTEDFKKNIIEHFEK